MVKIKLIAAASAVALCALVGVPAVSHADTFDLTSDHCTGGCGTPPFGTVTLTQNGANVDFVVALAPGENWANTGAADFTEFKFNGVSSSSSFSLSQTFPGQILEPVSGPLNGDGTGDFGWGIRCATCGNGNLGISNSILFEVTNTTIAALTVPNNLGFIFVADIFSSATGNTGPVAVPGTAPPPVPLPPAFMLFGTALVGMGLIRRRRSKDNVDELTRA